MESLLFALISQTEEAAVHDLHHLLKPIEENARHCAEAWNVARPAIVLCDKVVEVPRGCIPVVFVSDDTDLGALAVHFPGGYSRVHVDRMASFMSGPESVLEGACHEVLEALIDLDCNHWRPHPTKPGVEIALEVCDPVQNVYSVDFNHQSFPVANFVLPSYFEPFNPETAATACYDHACELDAPGRVGPYGYVVLRKPNGNGGYDQWIEGPDGAMPALSSLKRNALAYGRSRTVRRVGHSLESTPPKPKGAP